MRCAGRRPSSRPTSARRPGRRLMLEVEGLEVRYGAIRAVRGVSLRVGEGEIVAVLGANGAGKSSTLLAVAGALRPTGGRVRLDGAEVGGTAPEAMVRRGLAMVPE